jgi:hypothetical protein
MKIYGIIILILSTSLQLYSQKILEGERDPWLWPFSYHSIWNMPIGSNAIYVDAKLESAGHVGVDIQHILALESHFPKREVYGSEVWGPGRCDGTTYLGFTLKVPDNWIVPDAGSSPYGLTPNSNFALKLPNSDIVFEGSQLSRCIESGPVYLPTWMKYENNRKYQTIKGDGLNGGGQGASGMSALGGTIRLGELINEDSIRHALKINPWAAKYCFYHDTLPGFQWPAHSADNYAESQYSGKNPHLLMGSLLAIPPHIHIDSTGIETIPGKKLFFTMQHYGVYFTEDAAWDTWDIIVERGVEIEFEHQYGFSMTSDIWKNELNKMIKLLAVVVNNTPDNIGGGGTPMQPYAPEFQENITKIDKYKDFDMKIHPNPLIGKYLYLSDYATVKIYSAHGSLIGTFINTNCIEFSFKTGIYVIQIFKNDFMLTKRFIKI